MTEHTPGPWEYTSTGDIVTPDGKQIAQVTHGPILSNARLIAAAPDLLEAAKLAGRLVEMIEEKGFGPLPAHLYIVNQAIAKAEGSE